MTTISPSTLEEIRTFGPWELLHQQIVQHSAIHALEHLLTPPAAN